MFKRLNKPDSTIAASKPLTMRARSTRTACSAACMAILALTSSGFAQAQDTPAPQVLMAAGQKVKVTWKRGTEVLTGEVELAKEPAK